MAGEGEKSQTDEQGSSSAEVAALEDEVLDEQASSSAEVAALEEKVLASLPASVQSFISSLQSELGRKDKDNENLRKRNVELACILGHSQSEKTAHELKMKELHHSLSLVQHELASLAAEIREALGAQHTRNPAARLQLLQQSMREWVQRASHAASDEWLRGGEAEGTAARPRRTMVASGGLASRALGDALAGSTLPPTWQPQPPPKSAEQVWFAQEAPAAAEAKVLVSDVADNCAASGLVRRGDRVRNISPGCSRMYPGLQPYAP